MQAVNVKPHHLAMVAGAVVLAYLVLRGPQKLGQDLASAADGLAGGLVQGLGAAVGVPMTNPDKCAAAKASGSLWGQSFYCPAPDFIGSVLSAPYKAITAEPRPPLSVLDEPLSYGGQAYDEMGNVIY